MTIITVRAKHIVKPLQGFQTIKFLEFESKKFMKLIEIIRGKRMEIREIAHKYGAENIRIFGSVARGEENDNSDIDFLVDMKKKPNLLNRIAFMQELEDFLGRKVEVVTVKNLRAYFRDKVIQEAINL